MKRQPTTNTASGIQITMILLGILVTPVLLASSSLGNQLGLAKATTVIIVASLILTCLAVINISIGEKDNLPTYSIIKYVFGQQGATVINVIMAISLFGWIVVTANMFGHTVQDLLASYFQIDIPLAIIVSLGCIIFISSTAFGFEILGKVSKWAVPIISLLMLYILYLALTAPFNLETNSINNLSFGAAVSSVVGTIIVLVTTLPDFGSFSRNKKQAILAGCLTFGLAYPILYLMGLLPSALTAENSLIAAMAMIGTTLPAFCVLLVACITGNAGNMFQGTLVVSTLFENITKWKITLTLGIFAAIIGSFDIMSLFIPFLLFLGIITPPISGIYIADYFLYRRQGYNPTELNTQPAINYFTFLAWLLGSIIGFMTVNNWFNLTGIFSLDSILVASVCYIVFSMRKKL